MARLTSQQKFKRDMMNWLNDLLNTLLEISENYADELREHFNIIAESAIEDFYKDYTPAGYARKYDMYNAYKITVELDDFEINYDVEFDPKYMKYHGDLNDYLFNIVFEQGWHGGADKGNGHPEPGVPWYRNMALINKTGDDYESMNPNIFWLRRAERSLSPYEQMSKRMDEYKDKWEKRYINEVESLLKKKLMELKVILRQRRRDS